MSHRASPFDLTTLSAQRRRIAVRRDTWLWLARCDGVGVLMLAVGLGLGWLIDPYPLVYLFGALMIFAVGLALGMAGGFWLAQVYARQYGPEPVHLPVAERRRRQVT